jgi:hypothetical protein
VHARAHVSMQQQQVWDGRHNKRGRAQQARHGRAGTTARVQQAQRRGRPDGGLASGHSSVSHALCGK